MSAQIWNTYEMVGAAVTGVLLGGVPAIAFMVLKQRDGSRELATARGWWQKAIEVQKANERARWAPAYSGNLYAMEAADPDVSGEVLHVEHPTGEVRALHVDDPQVAAGLSRLADEVGLVRALSDRPAEDEDEVGDEQPGEATADAPARLWERLWTWLTDVLADIADRFRGADFWAQPEPQVPTGPVAELEAAPEVPAPLVLPAAVEVELDEQRAEWVAQNPPVNPPYTGRHWASDVQHTGVFPVINVPAQRTGDEA